MPPYSKSLHLEAQQWERLENTIKDKLASLHLALECVAMLNGICAHEAEVDLHLCGVPDLAMANSTKIESSLVDSMASDLQLILLETECLR